MLELIKDLIAEEVKQGFISLIPGGMKELQSRYEKIAVGKLGLVLAEGRSPRLVVDSSISMVTSNTAIPNRMLLPKVSDLCHAAPLRPALQDIVLLALDVSKAHRRILIHPDDRGLLCFHAGDELYQSVTLNFGARASGWYWGRIAGLMVRLVHHLLPPTHCVFQYVDDMLLWLDACPDLGFDGHADFPLPGHPYELEESTDGQPGHVDWLVYLHTHVDDHDPIQQSGQDRRSTGPSFAVAKTTCTRSAISGWQTPLGNFCLEAPAPFAYTHV